ncbi:hypothetical protein OROGR_022879 [Orobanche gracilis]
MGRKRRIARNKKKRAAAAASEPPLPTDPSTPPPTPPSPPPSPTTPPPPLQWTELPVDVTANILHRLSARDILSSAQTVCTTWRDVCKDPSMWRVIDMRNPTDIFQEDICRQAVDRSQGQLTEIYIDDFATDKLLQYICERSSQLICLALRGCDYFYYRVGEAVKRLPLLEEAHFAYVNCSSEDIEAIGRSCPKLRSFTLSKSVNELTKYISNDDALAVAKNMRGLRQLRLLGNGMSNEGLEAILAGCPLLESLDIRRCYNVDLNEDLGRRIVQKFRCFLGPDDPMEDCEWITRAFEDKYLDDWCSCCWSYNYSPLPTEHIASDVDVDDDDDCEKDDYDDHKDFAWDGFEYRGDRGFDLYVPFEW